MKSTIYTSKNLNKLHASGRNSTKRINVFPVYQSPSHVQLVMNTWTPVPSDAHPSLSPEFAQVHVCCSSDAIQSSCPLTPSSPALNSQHQGLFQSVSYLHQVTKILRPTIRHIIIKQIKRQRILSAQKRKMTHHLQLHLYTVNSWFLIRNTQVKPGSSGTRHLKKLLKGKK